MSLSIKPLYLINILLPLIFFFIIFTNISEVKAGCLSHPHRVISSGCSYFYWVCRCHLTTCYYQSLRFVSPHRYNNKGIGEAEPYAWIGDP